MTGAEGDVVYSRAASLPAQLAILEAESDRAGFRMIRRLRTEWEEGTNRFDGEGEAFFAALRQGRLVGVGGLNRDPYAADPATGRVRHLYVLEDERRVGVGRGLVEWIVGHAGGRFRTLRLWTDRAAGFYERLGFRLVEAERVTHVLDIGAPKDGKQADDRT